MKYLLPAFLAIVLFASIRASAQEAIFIVGIADYSQTEPDPPLNEIGRIQAEAWAKELSSASIDAVFSSERRRSRETVAPLARERGLSVVSLPKDATEELVQTIKSVHADDRVFMSIHDSYLLPLLRGFGYTGVVPSVILRDLAILVPRPGKEPILILVRLD